VRYAPIALGEVEHLLPADAQGAHLSPAGTAHLRAVFKATGLKLGYSPE